jgi:hypothetical protein
MDNKNVSCPKDKDVLIQSGSSSNIIREKEKTKVRNMRPKF